MTDKKKKFVQRDYWEKYQFKLTCGDNIICQRYFKIPDFNSACLSSIDLIDAIDNCVHIIENELKEKTLIYMTYMAPQVFKNSTEMLEFFEKDENKERIGVGHGIVIKGEKSGDYVWSKKKTALPIATFDNGEFKTNDIESERMDYVFSFLVDDRPVCTRAFSGYYPRDVRWPDLSNKSGKKFKDNPEITFRDWVMFKICEDREDLIPIIIDEIKTVAELPKEELTKL